METKLPPLEDKNTGIIRTVRSLRELIDLATGRNFNSDLPQIDAGLAEVLPYPFLGLVGQQEMKLALLLAVINPLVNGVLLIGPRGTGKTTSARSLVNLLPATDRSNCFYGCMPEDIETGGIDAVCPDCAKKYAEGIPLAHPDQVHLIELPLNSRIEDVIGEVDESAQLHTRMRLKRGILAQSDRNLLYVDEVNLLENDIVNAVLDAASTGTYTVRRGALSATYRSRFTFIGSMNPEEGALRPQIMDRFGLRIIVRGLEDVESRQEAYRRARAYRINPRTTVNQYAEETATAQAEIQTAKNLLPKVELPREVARLGCELIERFQVDSLRAEITLFEAARAYAAASAREVVLPDDLRVIAPMALRLRRSTFMIQYFKEEGLEDQQVARILDELLPGA